MHNVRYPHVVPANIDVASMRVFLWAVRIPSVEGTHSCRGKKLQTKTKTKANKGDKLLCGSVYCKVWVEAFWDQSLLQCVRSFQTKWNEAGGAITAKLLCVFYILWFIKGGITLRTRSLEIHPRSLFSNLVYGKLTSEAPIAVFGGASIQEVGFLSTLKCLCRWRSKRIPPTNPVSLNLTHLISNRTPNSPNWEIVPLSSLISY